MLGGTGFLGTNLAADLVRAGHRVIVAGREARIAPYRKDQLRSDVILAVNDIEAIVALVREQGIDTVVHMASAMVPSSSFAEYEIEQQTIALPTMALGRRLADLETDLVFMSSGGTVYGASPNGMAGEEDSCEPISFYGQAKLAIEADLAFLRRAYGLNYLIVRPSNPFGPHQSLRGTQGLISVILGKIADNRPLEVWGDGTSIRDYIYVDDFTASVRGLIEQRVRNTIVNLGSGEGHSLLEVVATVKKVTGCALELVFRPSRPVDVPRLVLNISRLRDLGLHHARSLEHGVRTYVDVLASAGTV
ncbi:hypothetical protein ASG67_15515 [Sphingomonas sp. Leaf339]|nr:hypothetical protein ASG67_15515 [Sphingomonas sp. Leaf339]